MIHFARGNAARRFIIGPGAAAHFDRQIAQGVAQEARRIMLFQVGFDVSDHEFPGRCAMEPNGVPEGFFVQTPKTGGRFVWTARPELLPCLARASQSGVPNMSCRHLLPIVAVMAGLLALAAPAGAGVSVLDMSLTVDKTASDATFTIDFPHAPDFFTVDSHGRVADSFQINISADIKGNPQLNPTTVVRGDEIHFANALRIRDGSPPVSDPQSGGYGAIRGTVPYSLNGTVLTFTTPLGLINAPNGTFSYYAYTLSNGVTAAQSEARSVPLPSALQPGMMMLGLGIVLVMCGRWRGRTAGL
jgi:hypothetical protein